MRKGWALSVRGPGSHPRQDEPIYAATETVIAAKWPRVIREDGKAFIQATFVEENGRQFEARVEIKTPGYHFLAELAEAMERCSSQREGAP